LTYGVAWGKIKLLNQKEIMLELKSKSGLEFHAFNPESIAGFSYYRKGWLTLFLKGGQTIEIFNDPKESGDEWENHDKFLLELKQLLNS
jgi:hypothetical protein